MNYRPIEERFFEKIKKSDGCWEWTASRNAKGYGLLNPGADHLKHRSTIASRTCWELHFGPIPHGMQVCHKCDNPPCVRPDHLFLGTDQENMTDSLMKGRRIGLSAGTRNGRAKLTDADVKEMRHLYFAERRPQSELAKHYRIAYSNVSFVVRGITWSHI